MDLNIKDSLLFEEFGYLIDKIKNSPFREAPFKHIIIDDFLSEEHFKEVTSTEEIKRPVFERTEDLIDDLLKNGYGVQKFPGCSTSIEAYLEAFNSGEWGTDKGLLDGFGLTFRLNEYKSTILNRLIDFLNTPEFKKCIENKFDITDDNYLETVFQKYLHGYEISPHPDIRRKAATYMLNLNPHEDSENVNIHTHLLKFTKEKEYIYDLWKNNKDLDRCWVPWDWCESEYKTTKNNSIVLFSPSDDSLHAIKLDYDHLLFQRTQIYGNLWYHDSKSKYPSTYHDLESSDIDMVKLKSEKQKILDLTNVEKKPKKSFLNSIINFRKGK